MGRETERETEHGQQTVLFEIVNGNALQACSLKTNFPTRYSDQGDFAMLARLQIPGEPHRGL